MTREGSIARSLRRAAQTAGAPLALLLTSSWAMAQAPAGTQLGAAPPTGDRSASPLPTTPTPATTALPPTTQSPAPLPTSTATAPASPSGESLPTAPAGTTPSSTDQPTLPPAPGPYVESLKASDKDDPQALQLTPFKEGFGFRTKDGSSSLKIRGVVQADARAFVEGGTNVFLLRRIRPTFDGTVYKFFDFRITAELIATPAVLDAYGNIRLIKEVQLRVGKFKSPIGLERLQNDPDMPFMERGLPSYFVSDRDTGAQLHGDIADGTVSYALGYFDGGIDSANTDTDNNDKKDVVGRIFLRPFAATNLKAVNLGLGFAASRGTQINALPRYVAPDQTAFFSYSASAQATGTHRRIAPQAYLYVGPVGLLAEWTRSSQIVTNGARTELLNHSAWQVEVSGFVTGEAASFSTVTPKNQLDPEKSKWGAVEIAARIGAAKIDDLAFDAGFADANTSARAAHEWALGLNWHLARGCKLELNYERTRFDGGARAGGDRPEQIAVLSRLQAVF
jgi:phosphate-selective porin OprO/OprP